MIQLAPLAPVPASDIEALLDDAFGADRHGRTAYRLREGSDAIPELSFAAFEGERLVGTLQSWPVELVTPSGAAEPLVMVGPVAVEPDMQGKGVGKALMQAMLDAADAGPWDALMMIGDPEYYGRFFGFTADATGGWRIEAGPYEQRRLLARLRRTAAATGVLHAAPDHALVGSSCPSRRRFPT